MWSDALTACDSAVAAMFDEIAVVARPRRRGLSVNDRGVDDEARPAFEFMASISLAPPQAGSIDIYDPGTRGNRSVAFAAVLTANAARWPWVPQRDDLFEAGEVQWVVVATDRHGTDRFVAWINKAR